METDRKDLKRQEWHKLVIVFCVAVIKELCFWLWPEQILLNTILKLIAGAAIYLICCGRKYRPSSAEERWIIISVLLFILADLLIRWQFLISGALFLVGHLLLAICFWRERKPTRLGIVIWIALTAVEAPFMIWLLTHNGFSLLIGCGGAVYGTVLALMIVCALRQETILTAAAILFGCSDLCLALHKAFASLKWMHIPSILLFYLSIGMFLLYCASRAHRGSCGENEAAGETMPGDGKME